MKDTLDVLRLLLQMTEDLVKLLQLLLIEAVRKIAESFCNARRVLRLLDLCCNQLHNTTRDDQTRTRFQLLPVLFRTHISRIKKVCSDHER